MQVRKSGFNYTHTPVKMEAQVLPVTISLQLLCESVGTMYIVLWCTLSTLTLMCVSIIIASLYQFIPKLYSIILVTSVTIHSIFPNVAMIIFFPVCSMYCPIFYGQLLLLGYDNYVVDQTDCK